MRISDWSSDVCSSDLDPDPVARKAKRRNRGQGIERLRPQRDDRERQRRGVQPLPARLVLRRGENGGVAHAKSVWIWRRILSRIAAARSLDSPGSVTVLLCVPEVWTIRCDRPNQRSLGPCPTLICWTRTNGTIVSVRNSQPRATRS